jgi:hypothetical protein
VFARKSLNIVLFSQRPGWQIQHCGNRIGGCSPARDLGDVCRC